MSTPTTSLVIPGLTPSLLGRPALWFAEHAQQIRNAVLADPWWQEHVLILDVDSRHMVSAITRSLDNLGYERAVTLEHVGQFRLLGDTLDIFPLAAEHPWRIEFLGNAVEAIKPLQADLPPPQTKLKLKEEILREGDYVVHADHGIGIFRGVTTEEQIRNSKSEIRNKDKTNFKFRASPARQSLGAGGDLGFLIVEYAPPPRPNAPPDRLLIPPQQRGKLTRYIGFSRPTIHRLGGTVWFKTRERVREETLELARKLLQLYAERELARRPPIADDTEIAASLAASFAHTETSDQEQAIAEIKTDLLSDKPMDRVLIGDVGFGKTEVALRAAAMVIASGKQVALIAPTTILAHQHLATFSSRLEALGIKTALLSRLTPKHDERSTVADLKRGAIDCVIGTHRLMSKDVIFKDLGLIIMDEEQRFGVGHKERFKELRADIDVLSLSATPIPRTLYLALSNLRAISTLSTPPPGRLPTATRALPFSWRIVREAIAAELERKGQVYYLHNRIETIEAVRLRLARALPKARLAVIHGRVSEHTLIDTMAKFRAGDIDVLVATTIIENGLDFSNANTLIVDNALRLGLSQAHQLRGRIGRGDVEAYAYFLYRSRHLTDRAHERLEALESYQHLGAGYEIAIRDLELRGAGNILGREQSGSLNQVGLNLYCDMLAEAVETLRENQNAKIKNQN
ncbi:DEAD/DEAH box helicase [Candidatus Parcubacteria bacterium]|nr:DEAD/DEAH box helicase [Candidatus Parcubacteria bacterium]